MSKKLQIGIIGSGDYARGQTDRLIKKSSLVSIHSVFDPNEAAAKRYTGEFGGKLCTSDTEIFSNPEIDIVCLFTPPWIRKDGILKAVAAGKHVITTKPLAASFKDADAILKAVRGKIHCAVFYRRTEDNSIDTLKRIFDSGEIGRLSLYTETWIHHFPQWNNWATDPKKNGGPFMDAMVHNLNIARYLMGTEVSSFSFFSDNHAQKLACNDTEFMKLDFGPGKSAHLFITWAGDLKVFSLDGNQRDHIGICHMVTDQGWFVKTEWTDKGQIVKAVKDDQVKTWDVKPAEKTPYDDFAQAVLDNKPQKFDVLDAWKDIKILTEAVRNKNRMTKIKL